MSAKSILTILALTITTIAYSQNIILKGKITDEKDNPLEFTAVSLLNALTNEEVANDFTTDLGNFQLEVAPGDYILFIESISGNMMEQTITLTKNEDIGTIKLKGEEVVSLQTATIEGTASPYRMQLDKKIYDVANDNLSKGSSISDALENVPSVQVDQEGTVSLRGNDNVVILVDGKPSSLIGITDPGQALKNLPADMVERVEVITNPSARYEAEGSAGIINIVLKKGKMKGLNGSVNINGGIPTSVGASANINYRVGKFNLFTNFGYRYSEWKREGSSHTTRFDSEGVPRFEDMINNSTTKNNNYNFMLGTEYYLDNRNTFTISGLYQTGKNNTLSELSYLDFDSHHNQTASSARTEDGDGDDFTVEGNFNFKHEFEGTGHELVFDVRATHSEDTRNSDLREIGDWVNSSERSYNFRNQNRAILSADYAYPFGEKGKFELGARTEFGNNLTDFKVDSLAGSNWMNIPEFSNRTEYSQNIYAAYAQFGQGFGNFSYFAGVRMESSDITVNSVLSNDIVNKNYTDFFPSLFLNYEFQNTDQLQLSYSRRMRRPGAWMLTPYTSYSDNRNIFMGNPDLNPQYTDSFELNYMTKFGKFMLTPNIYFSKSHDDIRRYRVLDPNTGAIVTRPINAGSEERYGGELTFTYRPWSWWNIMGNVNLFGYRDRGEHTDYFTDEFGETIAQTTKFDGDGFNWFGRISNSFKLPNKFSIQLSGYYRGGSETTQSIRKPSYGADLSISKDFWNDNASLTLNVRDLFNTRKHRSTSFSDNFITDSEFKWRARSINLTFSYRFNQSKRDEQRRKNNQNQNDADFEMQEGGI
ncbi:MAG: TonB-dependent receptor [Weeksellaceae bacterium]